MLAAIAESGSIKYERRRFETKIRNNPFAGDPRPELDLTWHGLLEGEVDIDFLRRST